MSMDEARAERLAELFEQALALSGHERAQFIAELSRVDPELGAELESLLASHQEAPDCLDALAARVLPEVVGELRLRRPRAWMHIEVPASGLPRPPRNDLHHACSVVQTLVPR